MFIYIQRSLKKRTFQNKLLCLFSSSHILWPMSIKALVLLRSYRQRPCQVSPHPYSPRLFISPGSVTSRLGWQCHTLPLTPPPSSLLRSPTRCRINSHSHPGSPSPVQSLRYFGSRSTPGLRACQCLTGPLLPFRRWGTRHQFCPPAQPPPPLPGHTALTCSRRHAKTVISLKGYSLVRSEIFTVLTKAKP